MFQSTLSGASPLSGSQVWMVLLPKSCLGDEHIDSGVSLFISNWREGTILFQAVSSSWNLQVCSFLNVNFSWAKLFIHSSNPVTFWLLHSLFKFWMISDSPCTGLGIAINGKRRGRNCLLCKHWSQLYFYRVSDTWSGDTRHLFAAVTFFPMGNACPGVSLLPFAFASLPLPNRTMSYFFPEHSSFLGTWDEMMPWNIKHENLSN